MIILKMILKKYKSGENILSFKQKLLNQDKNKYYPLVYNLLPFIIDDTATNSSNLFITNPIFEQKFKNGEFIITDDFLSKFIKIINDLHINLFIINATDYKLIKSNKIDSRREYNMFLLQNSNNTYNLITLGNKTIYTRSDFNTSTYSDMGTKSPPLFVYLYIITTDDNLASSLFHTFYNLYATISNQNKYNISTFIQNIKKGIKQLNPYSSYNQNNYLMSTINQTDYCYYITVTLDLYNGKLSGIQQLNTGCQIKGYNILNDFKLLTGIDFVPDISKVASLIDTEQQRKIEKYQRKLNRYQGGTRQKIPLNHKFTRKLIT